jgi:hypothetical protein
MEMYIISSPEKIGMPASKFATLKQIDRKHREQLETLKQRTAGAKTLLRRPVALTCKAAHQLLLRHKNI